MSAPCLCHLEMKHGASNKNHQMLLLKKITLDVQGDMIDGVDQGWTTSGPQATFGLPQHFQ